MLVFGGLGYLGSEIVPLLLSKGHSVIIVDIAAKKEIHTTQLTLLACTYTPNWLNFIEHRKIDAVFPLAAIVGTPACEKNPSQAESLNQETMIDFAAQVHENVLLVYPMTTAGYIPVDGVADENCLMEGKTVYAKTKIAAEKILIEKCNAVSLRFAAVYGRSSSGVIRNDTLVNNFVAQAEENKVIELYQPEQMRDIVHIKDVARAFLHALEHYPWLAGKAYNVGEQNIKKAEIVRTICGNLIVHDVKNVDGDDPDNRNFEVDHGKWQRAGFYCEHYLAETLKQW